LRTDEAIARGAAALLVVAALSGVGCRQDMHDQPRYKPLASTEAFPDGRASRPPVAGTVARGDLRDDGLLYTGKKDGKLAREFPFPVTLELMTRGQQRYDIFCSPCHDRLGNGRGMVVRRGLSQPPSFHIDRLRAVEQGYLFDVITNGFGRMSGYAASVPAGDRWAIVAYIRALQYSQRAPRSDVPPEALPMLDSPSTSAGANR
jgi:hypothetical protein